MQKTTAALLLGVALLAAGCTNPNDPTQRTLGGAAIGGAGGAALGAIAGGGRGALIGGVVGAGVGAVAGHATTPQQPPPGYGYQQPPPGYYQQPQQGCVPGKTC